MPIQIIDGFKLGASKPIDDRIVASGSVARFAIPNKYDGLLVVDTKDRKPYIWNADSGTWSSISSGSNGVPGSVITTGDKTYVGDTQNVYIGGSTTKNVYIGDAANKSDLNVTGVISGNGSNITNINPSNLSTSPGDANQVLQLKLNGGNLTPTWSTITTGGSNITAKVADTTSNYYIGFINNTSGTVSNIYTVSGIGATNGVLYSNGLSASIGTFTGLSASIGTFTGLSASIGTFSSLFVNFFNPIGLSASVGTFSYAFATGLSASVGTFSYAFATGLSASVGTFSRVFATGLSASVGTFSYAFATGLSASVGTFSRVIATFSSSLDLRVNRSATFSGNGRILAIAGNSVNSLSSIEIYKNDTTSSPIASIGYYESLNNNFIIKNTYNITNTTSGSQSIVLSTSEGINLNAYPHINLNTNVSSKYGVIITNSGKDNSYGLNVLATFTSTQLTGVHNCVIARFDSGDGSASRTSTYITRHGLYVQGDSTSNSGAVDKPSIAFNGSPTTGFYSDSANKIGISSNGVEKMSINTDGVSMISRMLNYWIVPIMSYGEGYTSLFLNPKDAGNTNSAISASNYGTPPTTTQISTNISDIVFPAATYDRIIYFYGGDGDRQLSVSLYLQVNSSDKEGSADIFKLPPGPNPNLGTTITSQDSTALWMGGSALQLKNYIGDADTNNIFRAISRTYSGTSISSNFIIPANRKFIITISLYVRPIIPPATYKNTKLQFSLFKFGK